VNPERIVAIDPSRVTIVLVRPSRPANVAAACRAMKNMGLSRLTLVEAPDGLGDPEARRLAYGAWDVLDGARRAHSLAEAVSACTLVASTSGKAGDDAWTPRGLATEGGVRAGSGPTAIVFGPESSGLTNAERALCHLEVRIPSSSLHSSLNLAQAVLIVCYEMFLGGLPSTAEAQGPVPRATAQEMEVALAELAHGLRGIGYLNPENPDAILAELRRLIARAGPTRREISLLRGLARQIAWAAGRIAPRPPRSG
jgi:tRNA/rRNA methyltransferase